MRAPKILLRLNDFWIDHISIDILAAIIFAGTMLKIRPDESIVITNHSSFFQTITAISLGILSLASLAITILVAVTPSTYLRELFSSAGTGLVHIMFRCLAVLLFTTAGFSSLFMIDQPEDAVSRLIIFSVSSVLLVLATTRLFWVLHRIVELLVETANDDDK
ncbi:MAG: hypothetical protein ACYDGS_09045 [Thermoleophilia bacterium]